MEVTTLTDGWEFRPGATFDENASDWQQITVPHVMDQALTLPLNVSHQLMVTRGEVNGVRLDTRGNTPWMYDAFVAK